MNNDRLGEECRRDDGNNAAMMKGRAILDVDWMVHNILDWLTPDHRTCKHIVKYVFANSEESLFSPFTFPLRLAVIVGAFRA